MSYNNHKKSKITYAFFSVIIIGLLIHFGYMYMLYENRVNQAMNDALTCIANNNYASECLTYAAYVQIVQLETFTDFYIRNLMQ